MRNATTRQTARYFADVLAHRDVVDAPLTFFTSSGQFPLVVLPNLRALFSVQKTLALSAIERLAIRRVGLVAAVALVDVEERSIDVHFVNRSRDDRRWVEGVMAFRAPTQRFTSSAVFTTKEVRMQSIEVTIKGAAGEPMVLVFTAADTAEIVAERLRTINFIVRQVDGQAVEQRRRASRVDRAATSSSSQETTPEP